MGGGTFAIWLPTTVLKKWGFSTWRSRPSTKAARSPRNLPSATCAHPIPFFKYHCLCQCASATATLCMGPRSMKATSHGQKRHQRPPDRTVLRRGGGICVMRDSARYTANTAIHGEQATEAPLKIRKHSSVTALLNGRSQALAKQVVGEGGRYSVRWHTSKCNPFCTIQHPESRPGLRFACLASLAA